MWFALGSRSQVVMLTGCCMASPSRAASSACSCVEQVRRGPLGFVGLLPVSQCVGPSSSVDRLTAAFTAVFRPASLCVLTAMLCLNLTPRKRAELRPSMRFEGQAARVSEHQ